MRIVLAGGLIYVALLAALLLAPMKQTGPRPGERVFLMSGHVTLSRRFVRDGTLNVLAFVPVGFLFAAALRTRGAPRLGRADAVVVGAAAFSLTAESAQYLLPSRYSSLLDVAWNTTGAALGILLDLAASARDG